MFFFFSSRRRHTRCGRDWSSDVCSSDLGCLFSRWIDTEDSQGPCDPCLHRECVPASQCFSRKRGVCMNKRGETLFFFLFLDRKSGVEGKGFVFGGGRRFE